jgi:hypothetical protein
MHASISFSRSIASKMFSVDEKPVTPLACGQQNVNKGEMNAFKTKSRAKGLVRNPVFFFENVQRTNSKKIEATGIWAWLDTNFSTK